MRNPPNEIVGLTVDNAMARLLTAATMIWKSDPHDFSKRPCDTCNLLSLLVGADWGCVKLRNEGK